MRWEILNIETDPSQRFTERMRHNGHMLQQKEFWWNIRRKKMCMMNILKHWNKLSRDVKNSPSLEIFITKLHGALCDWISPHLNSSWARGFAKVPSKEKYSVITYKCCSWICILYFIFILSMKYALNEGNHGFISCFLTLPPQLWFALRTGEVLLKFRLFFFLVLNSQEDLLWLLNKF